MNYKIRPAVIADVNKMQRLFYNTISTIGIQRYTESQIKAWTKNAHDMGYWMEKFDKNNFYVAVLNGEIVGFISLDKTGYIDYIYIHHNYQGQGIANALFLKIESIAKESGTRVLTSDVSYIAKPFFEKKGFVVLKKNEIEVDGEILINFSVKKMIA